MNRPYSDSAGTVNAAATAIATAESRVQPTTVQKRGWGGCWRLYWCFGSYKNSKRIRHAVLVPEPTGPGVVAPVAEDWNHPTAIVLPFIAPPSSPASFLQSDPPSATQSPAGQLSLTALSVNACSPGGTAPIFAIGPYAHETQLVSPPVFSTFTTEPSTASFTPPPEPVQLTTPSSPEVPFSQLLASSLARTRRSSGNDRKFSLSQHEFQPYQLYPGSPGSQLISPGSAISNSGTSSPFPDKRPIFELCIGENPKFLGYEQISSRKWGSRLGSGSLTPNGWGSRLGSGSLTPNGWSSRLGSGTLTPNGGEPASRDSYLLEIQISEVASLANSEHGSQNEDVINNRVSFELSGEDVQSCLEKKEISSCKALSISELDIDSNDIVSYDMIPKKAENSCKYCAGEALNEMAVNITEEEAEQCHCKRHSIILGSGKDFNFDHTKREVSDKPNISSEWWTNKKVVQQSRTENNWSFFPMLQQGVN